MNTNQIEIISQYLTIESNYALIINGDYGVGKTHFFKNALSPKIREISLPKNAEKTFKPIHISLFGFKTLEEIQTAIFVELFPILKNKGIKLAAGIGKSIIRGIAQINKAGDIDKYIGDIEQDANDWLNYDELVICFDDLDRKSETLDIRDVFGFINSLVENQGVKILIIANEEQLLKDKHYTSKLREKVIGVSVIYAPNPSEIFDLIIKDRYEAADKSYYDFLLKHKSRTVLAVKNNKNNFRNLIFFLEHFKPIYYAIELAFQDEPDFAVLKEEKLDAILNFTLGISIEYKLGLLNSTNIDDIKEEGNLIDKIDISKFLSTATEDKNQEHEPSYIELFKDKYYSNADYYFFKSIFNFITGSKPFSIEELKQELENHFITEEGILPEQELLLRELSYLGCLNLSDLEYRKKTFRLLALTDSGVFQLSQYVTVFHYITRFNNLLSLDLTNLKKRFRKGIKKGIEKYKYTYDLGFHMSISNDSEFREHLLEIAQYCIDINESLNKKKEQNELDSLWKTFEEDYNEFEKTLQDEKNQLKYSPFWMEFNTNSVYRVIRKLDNEKIWRLGHHFKYRYRRHIYEKILPEKQFINDLLALINNETKARQKKNLQNASLDYLSQCLTNSLNNFD